MSAEERSDQLEKKLKKEELRIIEVEKELSKLREIQVSKIKVKFESFFKQPSFKPFASPEE